MNLALLALASALVWMLRANWKQAQARERSVLQHKTLAKPVLAPPAPRPIKAAAPADYLEVAGKMLFSKDRNPTVEVEPPKPPPEPVMPALPNYHGQMAIGEPVILLSSASGAQRGYHAGEQVGDFKLLSFDNNTVSFEWKEKTVERKLEELRPKQVVAQNAAPAAAASASAPASNAVPPVASLDRPAPRVAAAAAPAASSSTPATPAAGQSVTSLSAPGTAASGSKSADTGGDSTFGPLLPSGDRSCIGSDTSPVGTVHSGYIKVQSMGIFGSSCSWTELK